MWRSFDAWEDKEKVKALAARSASLVDAAVHQERMQVRAYLDTYFKLNGDFDTASEWVPEIQYEYPRDEVTAFEVYQRPAREYGYRKGRMLQQKDQLEKELELANEEIAKIQKERPAKSGVAEESFSDILRRELEEFDRKAEAAQEKRDKVLDMITAVPFTEEDITEEAINLAIKRLEELANTDIQLARTTESANVLDYKSDVIGYRRVVHPELSESGTCGMCITASTRFYEIDHLEPIHAFCKCEVAPITGEYDPGKTMNDEDVALLTQMYDDAGGNQIDQLSNTRYKVLENSETGWVLTENKNKGEPAVSSSLRRSKRKPQLVRSRKELEALKANNEVLTDRYEDGETSLAPMIEWSDSRISEVEDQIKELVRLKGLEDERLRRKAIADAKREASADAIRKKIAAENK